MNLGEAKNKAIKLIDEYSNKGVLITSTKNIDYLNRMNQFADMAQREISMYKLINAEIDITQKPIINLLGDQMKLYTHYDQDLIFGGVGGKSYYMEVDNLADIYIEEQTAVNVWTELAHIINTVKGKFTTFTGLLTPSLITNSMRIRFSGSYIYNFRNIALYQYTFPTVADIPAYSPVRRYSMQPDYYKLNKIVAEYDRLQYIEIENFKWEGRNVLVLPSTFEGSLKILYFRYPTKITDDTLDSVEFEIDQEAQELIPLYIAQAVIKVENPSISSIIFSEYQNKLANLDTNEQTGQSEMQNVWNY